MCGVAWRMGIWHVSCRTLWGIWTRHWAILLWHKSVPRACLWWHKPAGGAMWDSGLLVIGRCRTTVHGILRKFILRHHHSTLYISVLNAFLPENVRTPCQDGLQQDWYIAFGIITAKVIFQFSGIEEKKKYNHAWFLKKIYRLKTCDFFSRSKVHFWRCNLQKKWNDQGIPTHHLTLYFSTGWGKGWWNHNFMELRVYLKIFMLILGKQTSRVYYILLINANHTSDSDVQLLVDLEYIDFSSFWTRVTVNRPVLSFNEIRSGAILSEDIQVILYR